MIKHIVASSLVLAALTGGAFAADLIVDTPASAPIIDNTVATGWDGAYLGFNVGYGKGEATSDGFGPTTDTIDLDGALAGLQIGYNFALSDNLVLGIEADGQWSNEKGSVSFPDDGNYAARDALQWTGALTAHLGVDMGAFMPYVLGGVAFAGNELSYYDNDLDQVNSTEKQTHTGYTVGVGLATKLTDSISAFAEYRYADYGTKTYDNDTGDVGLTNNQIRVGLNMHF